MTHALLRITTQYIDVEDRVRLAGEAAPGAEAQVIWLTQRVFQRLLPVLLKWLEGQGADTVRAEVLHSFAQQAARADLAPQAPVRADAGSAAWLAVSVDIAKSERSVSLTFRGGDAQHASLTLETKPLRQWLGIVHDAYLKAEWPLDVWPVWIRESLRPQAQRAMLH